MNYEVFETLKEYKKKNLSQFLSSQNTYRTYHQQLPPDAMAHEKECDSFCRRYKNHTLRFSIYFF